MNTVLEAGTHPLHGRSEEVSTLCHALRSAHQAGSLRVSLEGGPGTGKSRLLAEAATLAESAGATVLRGLHEDPVTYDGTVVVLLDDTHCSDEADVKALARVRLKAAGLPIVWCTSRRWGRPNSPLDIALGSLAEPHRPFRLGPLDEHAAQRMAHDILGAEPEGELARAVSSVAGHPQALRVLLEGFMDEGRVETGARARLTGAGLPEKFTGLVRRYLQDCSPSCTHLLLVASVLGTHLIFGELTDVLGLKPSQLLPDLQEAVLSGLLSRDRDDVRFSNTLFRQVILDSVPASARAAIRQQADEYRARQFGASLEGSGRGAGPDGPAAPVAGRTARPAPYASTAGLLPRATAFPGEVGTRAADRDARHAPSEGAGAVPPIPGWDHLTEKQVLIAQLTVQGLTNKEIAGRLYLSPHTVNYHLRKIFQALSIRSRTDLVRLTHSAAREHAGAGGTGWPRESRLPF
ncbi:LuxR family transcriptional regulator [Streptomyces sp.]|uniref:helix-turn-helix transcriptional regulator n=1 Tax=Streptomyces sp. TaxID=1931 RepID=UPI002D42E8DC|nr:LuxR family transcriptional regulator [Streptomyces sp.]HZF92300.1 LuxR family transcriptional regulator [Streptomyces sp.]